MVVVWHINYLLCTELAHSEEPVAALSLAFETRNNKLLAIAVPLSQRLLAANAVTQVLQ